MKKFQNKYRIFSTRLQNWDYRWTGAYFVTICTKNRLHYFGEIKNKQMQLSPTGVIADILWHEIKNHTQNVELGEFVVMPNHIHGVIIIADDNANINGNNGINDKGNGINDNGINDNGNDINVETGHALSLQSNQLEQSNQTEQKTIGQQRFQNIGKNSISSIVGSYKSAVTKHAHQLGFDFAWQTRFHDYIIRDDKSFQHTNNYIINNPANWQDDKFFNE
jgi:REP element-mobilizing transposase RayT